MRVEKGQSLNSNESLESRTFYCQANHSTRPIAKTLNTPLVVAHALQGAEEKLAHEHHELVDAEVVDAAPLASHGVQEGLIVDGNNGLRQGRDQLGQALCQGNLRGCTRAERHERLATGRASPRGGGEHVQGSAPPRIAPRPPKCDSRAKGVRARCTGRSDATQKNQRNTNPRENNHLSAPGRGSYRCAKMRRRGLSTA